MLVAEVTPITYTDFSSIITAMQAQISVSTVVGVLAAIVPVVIGLVFMWWGVRKGSKVLMRAFKSGKFKL